MNRTKERRMKVYSPKIKEDLIPKIYQVAKGKGIRMTTLVNEILEKVLIGGGEFESKEALSNGEEPNLPKKDGGECRKSER